MDKDAVEPVQISGFLQPFLVPKPHNHWRPILGLGRPNLSEIIRTTLQQWEWVTSIDFKDAYFHVPIQEQSRTYQISCPGSDIHFKALSFGLSTAPMDLTVVAGVETDGHTQGYNNPPVLRRLVGRSHIPPGLSPAYTRPSGNIQVLGWLVNLEKSELEPEAALRPCRLPVRPHGWSGPTYTGPSAESSGQIVEILSIQASSPRPTSYTHTVASQKQLEGTRVTRKGDSNTKVIAPTVTMVAARGQCPYRPTITPK